MSFDIEHENDRRADAAIEATLRAEPTMISKNVQDAMQSALPDGYDLYEVRGSGDIIGRAEDGRECRMTAEDFIKGHHPDSDLGLIERTFMEVPTFAKRAYNGHSVTVEVTHYVSDKWGREVTNQQVREFLHKYATDAFLESAMNFEESFE